MEPADEAQRQRQIAETGGEAPEPPPINDADRGEHPDRGTIRSFSPSAHAERQAALRAAAEAEHDGAEQQGGAEAPDPQAA